MNNEKLVLVDSPGYGTALGISKEIKSWQRLMEVYLKKSTFLHKILLLVDSQVGISGEDKLLLEYCQETKKPSIICYTKADLINRKRVDELVEQTKEIHKNMAMINPFVHFVSAKNGFGIDELKHNISFSIGDDILKV